MPFNTNNRPVLTPGPYATGPSHRSPFGRTTERFFAEGERHEAANWQDVVLPPDGEPEPCVRSGSFDEIPRRRSATITLVALAACLTFGIVASARFFLSTGHKVDAAKAAYTQTAHGEPPRGALPTAAPAPAHSNPSHERVPPAAGEAVPTPKAPVAAPPNASPQSPPTAGAGSVSVQGTAASPPHERTMVTTKQPVASTAPASTRQAPRPPTKKSRALRNYVWSPTAQALVPIDSTPAAAPTSAIDRADDAAHARSAVTAAPLSPPPAREPTIRPANTGAPPPERAAPAPEAE